MPYRRSYAACPCCSRVEQIPLPRTFLQSQTISTADIIAANLALILAAD
jgi:hypothetical protein